VVAFFILFFVLRAALVPGKPWLVTLTAALAANPFTLGLWGLYRHANVPDPAEAAFAALRTMLSGVAAAYVVSRTMYGLRRVARQAVQLGQYVIHDKIGEGGMGAVYRASHAMLKRPTAIKLVAAQRSGAAASARFEREVLAASRLSHPNNVAIYDFGRTRGGVFYYAMELLDGVDLARLVEREGPQPVARALHILVQLADALAEAHEAGLVHRDVKPANVMLCTRGGITDFVKVLDFGLVKDVSTDVKLTADTSVALGTPLYMAPEAIVTPEQVGPPADVYALGCIAYELLTARPPFQARAVFEVCAAHVYTAPERPSLHVDGIPAGLEALILRCLAKDPASRPATRALAHELRRLHT
jgi:eukaryotic-like serine/threonine-protein kinase